MHAQLNMCIHVYNSHSLSKSVLQESLVSAEESIKDLEHVEVLMKKHDDFQKDTAVNEARLDSINTLAQSMVDDGHSDADEIQQLTEVRTHTYMYMYCMYVAPATTLMSYVCSYGLTNAPATRLTV